VVAVGNAVDVAVSDGTGVIVGVGTAVAVGPAVGVMVGVGVGTGLRVTVGVGVLPDWQATSNNTKSQFTGKRGFHNLMKLETSLRILCNGLI